MGDDDRFCLVCGIVMELHFTDDDCGGAARRVELLEAFARPWSPPRG